MRLFLGLAFDARLEDRRLFSLNPASEADPHIQSQEMRLVGRDGLQSSLRRSRRCEPARVRRPAHVEGRETWRVLEMTYPDDVPAHTKIQQLYSTTISC